MSDEMAEKRQKEIYFQQVVDMYQYVGRKLPSSYVLSSYVLPHTDKDGKTSLRLSLFFHRNEKPSDKENAPTASVFGMECTITAFTDIAQLGTTGTAQMAELETHIEEKIKADQVNKVDSENTDPLVRLFFDKVLPELKKHEQQAKEYAEKIKQDVARKEKNKAKAEKKK